MTTIAWDGTTLAADRASWSGGTRRRVRKVERIVAADGRVFLAAFSGDGAFCHAVKLWMRGEADRPDPKEFDLEAGTYCAIVIDERRRVWLLTALLHYLPFREHLFAGGAGQEFVWGALEAGASARRAVQIAAKRSDHAGLGVDCVSFRRSAQ
ncbi:MAG: hypothetical protein IPJ61_18565 [Tessaracoccus sp.]|uniref:hypothetical protein n=1 Tax=Tessaracoccus sp. TaxID=1971211 RepID=UPI001EB42ABE|nr:hypothetical protein [Tessaracoccus sp.]MBK7822989.1 hypothetical protein [Tessaracoccus sp.]